MFFLFFLPRCLPPFRFFDAKFYVFFRRRRHRQPRIGVEFDFAALFRKEIFGVRLVGNGSGKLGIETREQPLVLAEMRRIITKVVKSRRFVAVQTLHVVQNRCVERLRIINLSHHLHQRLQLAAASNGNSAARGVECFVIIAEGTAKTAIIGFYATYKPRATLIRYAFNHYFRRAANNVIRCIAQGVNCLNIRHKTAVKQYVLHFYTGISDSLSNVFDVSLGVEAAKRFRQRFYVLRHLRRAVSARHERIFFGGRGCYDVGQHLRECRTLGEIGVVVIKQRIALIVTKFDNVGAVFS